jgi:hypothetical protein
VFSRLSPITLKALEHDVQALRLRLAGHTFAEIATALGFRSKGSAWNAVNRAKTARLMELARLVERLGRADAARQFAAVERRLIGLQERGRRRSRQLPMGHPQSGMISS